MTRLTLLTIVLLAFTACGDDVPNVGGTCTATEGCDEGLSCDTSVPAGYCTTSCTTSGSTDQCPEDSVCDTVAGTTLTCVKICQNGADCRSDQDCNGVSGTNIKACKPKP